MPVTVKIPTPLRSLTLNRDTVTSEASTLQDLVGSLESEFPGMRERRWGRIICMASIAGLMGGFGQTAYATSKIGLIGFAKSVALEGARYNVTCNAIAPGIIAPNAKLSPLYDRMVKRVAMQREGDPEDIANAIAFLCSERARYITGAVLTVTGGMDLFTF